MPDLFGHPDVEEIDDAIFDDARAWDILATLFDTPDGAFDPDRDWERARSVFKKLKALGYNKPTVNTFMNEELDCCEPMESEPA